MGPENDIKSLMQQMTDEQQAIFVTNLDLWEKTVQLNNRPQHFDSFDVDKSMLLQEWFYLLEDINSLNFEENLSTRDFHKSNSVENNNETRIQQAEEGLIGSSISPAFRFEILERDGLRCQLCGATAKHRSRLEIDHKISKKDGGTNNKDNLWTLCFTCNRGKGSKSM